MSAKLTDFKLQPADGPHRKCNAPHQPQKHKNRKFITYSLRRKQLCAPCVFFETVFFGSQPHFLLLATMYPLKGIITAVRGATQTKACGMRADPSATPTRASTQAPDPPCTSGCALHQVPSQPVPPARCGGHNVQPAFWIPRNAATLRAAAVCLHKRAQEFDPDSCSLSRGSKETQSSRDRWMVAPA